MIIYKVTNKINGKEYVGQTVKSLKQRKQKHISDVTKQRNNFHFHNALRKYGSDNFTWKILQKCDIIEELNKLEIYYIGLYNTFEKGYNLTLGGGGNLGYKASEETRKKMSENKKGSKNHFYGKTHTEETKKKIYETAIGRIPSEETRKKMSKSHKDFKHSEESKRKMSELALGRIPSKKTRGKLSEIAKNRVFSKETRKKISEAHKGKIISEETKQRMSKAAKKGWAKRKLLNIGE
jgi:group I intron endonuclease